MTAACIFCGRGPTTNAHIFRRGWTKLICPTSEKFRHRRGDAALKKPTGVEFIKNIVDEKVKSACGACNAGWMNDLDHAAEDLFLTNAALGYPVKMSSPTDKHTLARWCALIGVLLDQRSNVPVLPHRIHDVVYQGQAPEDGQVWLFNTEPPDDRDILWGATRHLTFEWTVRGAGVAHVKDFYFATFCVKHLVVHLVLPTEGTPTGVKFWTGGGGAFSAVIWPPEVTPLTPLVWPPPQTVRWEDALDFPEKMTRIGK